MADNNKENQENKENKQALALRKDIGDAVINRINQLSNGGGLAMPADFSAETAIKMTMLKLQDLKNKDGKAALEVCTKESVVNALFGMCLMGLNCGYNQCYPIVRGDKLCIDPSYFGKVLMVKRVFPDWDPLAHVIRQGDVFEFAVEEGTGLTKLIKHETKLENMDNDFIGAYLYLPTGKGLDLYIMTAKEIRAAWAKSSSTTQGVHKAFTAKMVKKTIINSGCNIVINATPLLNGVVPQTETGNGETTEDVEYTELDEETGEIKTPQGGDNDGGGKKTEEKPKDKPLEQPKPQGQAQMPFGEEDDDEKW